MLTIEVEAGDITTIAVDAIVHAANEDMLPADSVSRIIFEAAGHEDLLRACMKLAPCPEKQARITPAFALPARRIIHAVAPCWQGGSAHEDADLAATYEAIFTLAAQNECRSLACCPLERGGRRWPAGRAAHIAMRHALKVAREYKGFFTRILFVGESEDEAREMNAARGDIFGRMF